MNVTISRLLGALCRGHECEINRRRRVFLRSEIQRKNLVQLVIDYFTENIIATPGSLGKDGKGRGESWRKTRGESR